jgi:hypothetical protein
MNTLGLHLILFVSINNSAKDLRLSSFSNFLLFSRILENLIIVDDLSL